MILQRVDSNRVWIERAELSLKLHKILNLGTLSLKTSGVKSDERFRKWRKIFTDEKFCLQEGISKNLLCDETFCLWNFYQRFLQ